MKIGEYEVKIVSNETATVGCQVVTQEQVTELLNLMVHWKPAQSFKVGDFVRVRDDAESKMDDRYRRVQELRGKYGRVVTTGGFASGEFGIEFSERIIDGHTLNGSTAHGHGYFLLPEMLEKVD